ncbi:Uncharacterised protein [Mycobacterium tuberculosis]|uniref:Uncharacterized protein n=1 Tax=Mycobacterium tuberculosis TaxID=1773 RepID=A0A654U2C6_MYCTX|nr:Uncharacterised protein [Mycobacterium tuberculosis]CKS66943.1 Uncharacterised protein [Mycobacterium tuberculosis]
MTGQWQVPAHGAIRLLPAQQTHSAGEDCQNREHHTEHLACAGDRQFRDELHQGDRRGQQA